MAYRLTELGVASRQGPHVYPRIFDDVEAARAQAERLLAELPEWRRPMTVRITELASGRSVETVRRAEEDGTEGGPFDDRPVTSQEVGTQRRLIDEVL